VRSEIRKCFEFKPRFVKSDTYVIACGFDANGDMASLQIAARIRARAAEVSEFNVWIGFFEWVCWSFLKDKKVLMLFGPDVYDIRSIFGPAAPAARKSTVRVAAVQSVGGTPHSAMVTKDAYWPKINHYLIGVQNKGVTDLVAPAKHHAPRDTRCAVRAAALAGWTLKHTNATGDCGIDVMAYHEGMVRIPSSFQTIRRELAAFMVSVANEADWQDCYMACQALSWEYGMFLAPSPPLFSGRGRQALCIPHSQAPRKAILLWLILGPLPVEAGPLEAVRLRRPQRPRVPRPQRAVLRRLRRPRRLRVPRPQKVVLRRLRRPQRLRCHRLGNHRLHCRRLHYHRLHCRRFNCRRLKHLSSRLQRKCVHCRLLQNHLLPAVSLLSRGYVPFRPTSWCSPRPTLRPSPRRRRSGRRPTGWRKLHHGGG